MEDDKGKFIGKAFVYDDEVFVDTTTGKGYDQVIEKMKEYVNWYSGKVNLLGFDKDDIKQLIVVYLLDGIRRYDPNYKIKLSTFLCVHVKNRMISRIKDDMRESKNATHNEQLFRFKCECGFSFTTTKQEGMNSECIQCKKKVSKSWDIKVEHNSALLTDATYLLGDAGDNRDINHDKETIQKIENALDISALLKKEDHITRSIGELMLKDYSITDIAKELNITGWGASLKLRRMGNKERIKDFFIVR